MFTACLFEKNLYPHCSLEICQCVYCISFGILLSENCENVHIFKECVMLEVKVKLSTNDSTSIIIILT